MMERIEALRHTAAHVMAQAVMRLWPDAKLAIGPAIKDGFYYDFDLEHRLTSEDLSAIEGEMRKIVKEELPLIREELSKAEAVKLFTRMNQPYKLELLAELPEQVSVYRQGEFVDLCQGPHVDSTAQVKHFKLQTVAGAYWRGDSSRPMLQRIYGTAFSSREDLEAHLRLLEEAAKRDHRKLGRELDLFSIQDEGPGFPFFHPKGMVIRNALEDFWRAEHIKRGYHEVKTPIMLHEDLWHRSGHWDNYRENMYFSEIDEQRFAIKPMNCPGGMLLYKRKLHSYRDLPLRVGELGLVHRHELSGALHGLMRVRCFTQDDAHIFMLPSQVQAEIEGVIEFIDAVYSDVFGFRYHVELSTKPANAIGDDAMWERATQALKDALAAKGLPYVINEGDGAFYGPKIDFHLEDSIGRTWQCGTIQLDFAMPERFDLVYIDEDGQRKRPAMLHRVIFGSIERFIGILTEHYAGAFPLWLAPVQVMVIPVSDGQNQYALEVEQSLRHQGLRVESDMRSESVGKKIRAAQLQKVPYMVIVGEREAETGMISVRHRQRGDLGGTTLEPFCQQLLQEIAERR
ncbi:MAG: threonine--tRNA ligase [Firmicutes bacterium]|jgi:threonyl-tRNA synthetase|nr:threonine--tRNA ligase [Bacillota bacterium]